METITHNKQALDVLLDLYDLHSQLFLNVIDGISDKDANNRLNTHANHPSWIAGSLVHERFDLAGLLGSTVQSEHHELFSNHQGLRENTEYPVLKDYVADWKKITPILREALQKTEPDKFEQVAPVDMGKPISYYELIYFIVDRESYCIGQLGIYRRLMGYPAMKYPE